MEQHWTYKGYDIRDGLKPDSQHFQYFYVVSEQSKKKANYCVWIQTEALTRFDPNGDFGSIISSHRENWRKWVKGKIDAGDFDSRVLKYSKDGEEEIDLSEMTSYFSME
jgi:hypothetical protein